MNKLITAIALAILLTGCGPSPEEVASQERAAAEQKHNQNKAEAMDAINRAPFPCGEIVRLEEDFADRATCSNGEVYVIRYVSMPVGKKVALSCSSFDQKDTQKFLRKHGYRITKDDCINGNPMDSFRAIMNSLGYRETELGGWVQSH